MSVIYEPRGKAKEYCELAVNLYHGCDHGCLYCYAPNATYKSREEFSKPKIRKGIIEAIKKEAPAYRGREVLLCFTCDPYSRFARETDITRRAIMALHDGGVNINILSKGGLRCVRDFDILKSGDKFGQTLTFMDEADSSEWEPGAATPAARILCLEEAHERGIFTWASLEPVIKPETTLHIIEQTHEFVDMFKVGKWNHDKRANEIDWRDFGTKAVTLLKKLNKKYMIKKDLAAYL